MYSKDIKLKVIQDLNEKYGKKLLDNQVCTELRNNLIKEKNSVQEQLDISSGESTIGQIIKKAVRVVENAEDINKRAKEIKLRIKETLDTVEEDKRKINKYLEKLKRLQCTLQYIRVLQHIEGLSLDLQREIGKGDDERCATLFANLTEISRNLTDFVGVHLQEYLNETIRYWHNILKEKLAKLLHLIAMNHLKQINEITSNFSSFHTEIDSNVKKILDDFTSHTDERDFGEILVAIKWPFVSTNFSLVVPLPNHIQKLQTLTEYLLQIELPSESSVPIVTTALLSDFPPLCLPIHLLIQPLRKRFIFHFYGARQTNRLDKPEWYFTQILTWVRDHRDFVDKYVQPVIEKLGLHHTNAKLELMRGLVQIAVEKLHSDLPNLQFDDFAFSHSIDEALGFDRELRETYEYPPNQPNILAVLTQAQVFVKWIAMEKKYAIDKMDAMLPPHSLDAFEPLTSDVEDLKITTCADAVITLLQTITERYESLSQPGHRLQFLELQLELLDDFRVRLLQLVNAEEGNIIESKIPSIANSIYYIENVLIDWGSMLHYLNLYYYKSQLETAQQPTTPALADFDESYITDIDTDTVFAETLSLYRHMRKDLLHTLAETVIAEVKSRSKGYRRERWSIIKLEKEFRSLSLTPTACPMFEILSKRLHQLQKSLQSKLFTSVWRSIAQQLDTYLFEELVLDNRFSEGGSLQFKFDITRNLIPLFSQFSERPHNYFTQIIESCNLLNLSKGSALLLRETILALEGATGVEDTRGKALKEIGVNNFTPKMAVRILNQRADITINRVLID